MERNHERIVTERRDTNVDHYNSYIHLHGPTKSQTINSEPTRLEYIRQPSQMVRKGFEFHRLLSGLARTFQFLIGALRKET